jgi:CarD family transcriptional regulator
LYGNTWFAPPKVAGRFLFCDAGGRCLSVVKGQIFRRPRGLQGRKVMLAIGDKVVYPMHGAGIIEAIEEREIHGENRSYFVLGMIFGDMKVMIPVSGADHVGVRPVIDQSELGKVQTALVDTSAGEQHHANWNRRFNMYLGKLKSGNICEVADVVRLLVKQEKHKKLSTGERRLLNTAKQILLSELMLSFSCDLEKADLWLREQF